MIINWSKIECVKKRKNRMNRDVGEARDPGIMVHPAGHPGGFRVNECARRLE